ncbi:MAG TPA: LuxR family transcriptional regulator [Acidimicrobiales bacterium]
MPEFTTAPPSGTLVGRDDETRALALLLDHVPLTDVDAVAVVSGEAGVGKTALLDWLAATARDRGVTVLRASGVEFERGLSFSGLVAVLRPLLDRLDALTDVQARALRGALGLTTAEAPTLAVYAATLSLLSLGADAAPVLVVVDDAHWLDPASLEALVFAAHRCGADGVGFAFARRPDHPCALDQARFPTIDVAGLDPAASVTLLGAQGVAPAVAEICHRLTHGNPLALIEGARGLSPAQRRGEAPLPAALPVDRRLLDEFRAGLAGLPAAALRALGAAALTPDDDLAIIAAALAEMGGGPGDLDPAERAGVLERAGGVVRWRHPLLRCAAHDGLPAGDRRTVHRALSAATAAAGRPERSIWHLAQSVAGPDEAVADHLESTAAAAYRRGALAAAAEAYEQAARLSTSPAGRDRRLLRAADVRWAGGDFERAASLLRPAIERTDDPVSRGHMAVILGQAETWLTSAHRSAERLEEHARAVADLAPDLSALLGLHAAVSRLLAIDFDGALHDAEVAMASAGRGDDATVLFGAHAVRALASFFAGQGPAAEAALEPIAQVAMANLDDRDDQGVAAIVALCAFALVARGGTDRPDELLTELVDRTRASGMLARTVTARLVRADARWRAGRWAQCLADLTDLLALQEAASRPQMRMAALALASRVYAGLGDEDACRRHAAEAIELATPVGTHLLTAWALSGLGLLDLAAGRHAEAAAGFDRVDAVAGHVREPGVLWWHADAIEAYHGCGRAGEARELLERLGSMAEATGRLWARAAADRSAALIGAGGDPEARLTGALAGFRALGAPFEEARTLLVRGEHRVREGRPREGGRDLAEARTLFDRLGARAWSDRASAGRGEAGSAAASLASQLSQAELRVALAVGQGASNREAAEALFISVKTVDYHLQSIYRKLGLRSRTQLAALVAADRSRPPAS